MEVRAATLSEIVGGRGNPGNRTNGLTPFARLVPHRTPLAHVVGGMEWMLRGMGKGRGRAGITVCGLKPSANTREDMGERGERGVGG